MPAISLGNAYTPQTETASATLGKEGTVWAGKAREKRTPPHPYNGCIKKERHIEGHVECPYPTSKSDQPNRYAKNYLVLEAPCPLCTNLSQSFMVLTA